MPKKTVPNASVFVKNLPYDAKEVDLKDVFSKFGRLRDVYIPLDFHTKVIFSSITSEMRQSFFNLKLFKLYSTANDRINTK